MTYSLDTSALLDAWVRYYPRDVFDSLWKQIEQLVSDERLLATEVVRWELEKKDDDVLKWVKARPKMFIPLDGPIQVRATAILQQFPSLTESNSMMQGSADPFVIALAAEMKLTVVCSEKRDGNKKPKIPNACEALGIDCIGLVEFFRREKWRV